MTRGYLPLLLTLAAVWGGSFMFIELALEDLEPAALMEARLALGALALLAVLWLRRGWRRATRELRGAGIKGFALGIPNSAVPFTLIAWGQQHVDSGVAAIANASVPIFVALLAIRFSASERATGSRLLGIVLGLVGVAILVGLQPDASWWAAIGTLAVVAASFSYAVGSLLVQSRMADTPPLALSTATTIGAALFLLPFGLAQLPADVPTGTSLGAVAALALLGTALGLLLFFRIIDRYGSARASLVTYLLPVTALLYGALLLGEPITPQMLAGLALILAGVALGSGVVAVPRRAAATVAPRA